MANAPHCHHDRYDTTFFRVLDLVDPACFEAIAAGWPFKQDLSQIERLAVDGKVLRGTGRGGKPIALLPLVTRQLRTTLRSVQIAGKSNEIPAALAVHLQDLVEGGLLIANSAAFTPENLAMAGYTSNPLGDPAIQKKYEVLPLDITGLAVESLKDSPLTMKEKLRAKNFFALGFTYWVYGRPLEPTIDYINSKWAKKAPDLAEANIRVLKAGYFLGETTETNRNRYMCAGGGGTRDLSKNFRQRGACSRVDRRREKGRPRPVILGPPDHARLLDSRNPRGLQTLRREDRAGGG